jgi:hypothetical protein
MHSYTLLFSNADRSQLTYEECIEALSNPDAIAMAKDAITAIALNDALVKGDDIATLINEHGDIIWRQALRHRHQTR